MRSLNDQFRNEIAQLISPAIKSLFEVEIAAEDLVSDFADVPNLKMGQLAFPCFKIAKQAKKNPKEAAETLQNELAKHDLFAEIKAVGPFLNLFLNPQFYGRSVLAPMVSEEYFKTEPSEDAPYLIEYSQPNTHKELHVGHMRNLCYGHALVLLFEFCGNKVVTATFPGDVGTHVAKCLWYLKHHNQEAVPAVGKGEWLGRMYSAAHNKLEDEKGSELEDKNREQLTEILKQIERKEGEYFDLWKETREWSLELMNSIYAWAGVSFDRWFFESEVDSSSVELVKKLHTDGKLVESDGAIGMDLNDAKLGFCLLLKSDGNGLYATKDLDLMRLKFAEYNPQKNIYIVDQRQELHFKQVMESFERLGFGAADRSLHLKYNFVELPDGAMSSRKGNIIPITELISKMQELIKTEHLERYKGEWSDSEIEDTADAVAKGAIAYGMNRMDPNKKIVFDMKDWLRLDGESGPYIQYAHARICSILRKQGDVDLKTVDWSQLNHDSEIALMVHLAKFQFAMHKSLENFKTSGICAYIYDLSKLFNTFYHDCSIAKAETEDLKNARLGLASAVRSALKQGLALIGVPAPEKM